MALYEAMDQVPKHSQEELIQKIRQAQSLTYGIARHAIEIRSGADKLERLSVTIQADAVEVELLLQIILDALQANSAASNYPTG